MARHPPLTAVDVSAARSRYWVERMRQRSRERSAADRGGQIRTDPLRIFPGKPDSARGAGNSPAFQWALG